MHFHKNEKGDTFLEGGGSFSVGVQIHGHHLNLPILPPFCFPKDLLVNAQFLYIRLLDSLQV